jgi:hypothetical protein
MTDDDPTLQVRSDPVPGFVNDLERALGIGIMVQSIEDGPTVRIEALVLLGQHSELIVGVGTTETKAWRDLARSAIAWRTTNDKHVPWWGGGGA